MISDVGYKRVLNLIDIAIADRLGMYNPVQPAAIDGLKEMKKLVKHLHKSEGRFTKAGLAIDGDELMHEFQLKPGPKVGQLIDAAFEWVLEDVNTRNHKKKILDFLKG